MAGTTGLGPLDNISIFEKLEDESTAWAARTGGSLQVVHDWRLAVAGAHAVYTDVWASMGQEAEAAARLEEALGRAAGERMHRFHYQNGEVEITGYAGEPLAVVVAPV